MNKSLNRVIMLRARSLALYFFSLIIVLALGIETSFAQDSLLSQARKFVAEKDTKQAVDAYEKAYGQSKGSGDAYQEYLDLLTSLDKYKQAEQLILTQQQYNSSPVFLVDLGKIYEASKKDKKAIEQYDLALTKLNGDESITTQLAAAYTNAGQDDYALKTYERARVMLQNPYLYSGQIAKLYAKTGAVDRAVETLLDGAPGQFGGFDEVKANLLVILGNDPKKLQLAQKAFLKRINAQPENIFYVELLTWLYIQKNDWDGALLQIEAIDERNKESGQRMLQFASVALREKQPQTAIKSLNAVIDKGKGWPLYATARMQKLDVGMQMLEDNPAFTKQDVLALETDYDSFFVNYPEYIATPTLTGYAMLEAQYNSNPKKAISLLKKAIEQPNAPAEFIGKAKLQMGDYLILDDKVWEASLTYSQVDKAFKEDMLGEDARFRNAKLAYYRGDFEWAQTQLSVLKASTSELIANDALYLSVLITENMPDSIQTPLLRYAHADLLLFQNKDAEAITLLDSIAKAWPKHPLNDDILMLHADISIKHRDYDKALGYLKDIVDKYGKDVLADDAVFKTAEIYDTYLKKPEEAKKYYEQLIIDYPGSTFVQTARQRLQAKPA